MAPVHRYCPSPVTKARPTTCHCSWSCCDVIGLSAITFIDHAHSSTSSHSKLGFWRLQFTNLLCFLLPPLYTLSVSIFCLSPPSCPLFYIVPPVSLSLFRCHLFLASIALSHFHLFVAFIPLTFTFKLLVAVYTFPSLPYTHKTYASTA